MLFGRATERARIERLLDDARGGRSGVLVLSGEPGIGKTTLLAYARDLAESMTVVSATGIEAEAEVEFSGLLELARPLLRLVDEIPAHQRDVLREAVGLDVPCARDAFATGAALLSLLAAAAEERPTLVLVDDAHWLDRASADAIRFAARRLLADRVAFVFALRTGEGFPFDVDGFSQLDVGGLDLAEAGAILERSALAGIDGEDLALIHESTGGNPLALAEIGAGLTPDRLATLRLDVEPLPVGSAVQDAFARRALELPPPSRTALGVVSASSTSDLDVIAAALDLVGVPLSALEDAEDAGLVVLEGGSVTFRHPLVRSAVHGSTPPSERRVAHAALGAAFGEAGREERRAWHLASATLGVDEAVAAELDELGARSAERGAHAAAASALEQAARLSADRALRLDRHVRAAEAAWASGSPELALTFLDRASVDAADDLARSRILALRGRLEGDIGVQSRSQQLLLEAAGLIEEPDPLGAASVLMLATTPLYFGGDVGSSLETARRARALVPEDGGPLDVRGDIVLGWALAHAGELAEATPILERALGRLLAVESPGQPALQNARLALDILERAPEVQALSPAVDTLARANGPVALLRALEQDTRFLVRAGEWERAVASGEEALAIAGALGHEVDVSRVHVLLAVVEAARGEEVACASRLDRAGAAAERHGLETLTATVGVVRGLLALGLGRLEEAAAQLEEVAVRSQERGLFARDVTPEPDLVEALLGLDRPDEAREWLEAYEARGSRASPQWGAALVARCRGLLAGDDEFEAHFLRALEFHGVVPDRFAEARTALAYGERLRRAGRKRDARDRLRQALGLLEPLAATPWIVRARRELRATGERLGRRSARVGDELTPQELQVALQVSEGKTNKDVGAALFLSPKTVEFHLARVYRKLDISSRAELIRRFATQEQTGEPAASSAVSPVS